MIAARPLTIAEIFDRTVTIAVRRWRIVLAFVAVAATPAALIIAVTRGHDTTRAATTTEFVTALLVGAFAYSPLVRVGGDAGAPNDLGAALRRAAADYWRSLGSFVLLYAVLFVAAGAVLVIVAVTAVATRAVLGPLGFLVAAIVVGLLGLAALLPLFVVTTIAYANSVLERVSPWRGLTSAVTRCARASPARTWLLGAALLIVSVVPFFVVTPVLRQLSAATGMWWVLLPEPYLTTATGIAFGTIAGAVAAVDYRNRFDGADLHAVLDAPASAS